MKELRVRVQNVYASVPWRALERIWMVGRIYGTTHKRLLYSIGHNAQEQDKSFKQCHLFPFTQLGFFFFFLFSIFSLILILPFPSFSRLLKIKKELPLNLGSIRLASSHVMAIKTLFYGASSFYNGVVSLSFPLFSSLSFSFLLFSFLFFLLSTLFPAGLPDSVSQLLSSVIMCSFFYCPFFVVSIVWKHVQVTYLNLLLVYSIHYGATWHF